MKSNYAAIIEQNLSKLQAMDMNERCASMAAACENQALTFQAFARACAITPDGIFLDGEEQWGPTGIILSLYALNATPDPCRLEPLQAFKAFPNSAPYAGAFASHTEQILVQAVDRIIQKRQSISDAMAGGPAPAGLGGDAVMVVYPLPKIALCYIFYEADEDFPASATCLFSNNANLHMPLDGLADVGEYTSRAILELAHKG